MNLKEFKKIVNKEFPRIIKDMGMEEWEIPLHISFKGTAKDLGEIRRGQWKYKSAHLYLYAEHHETVQDIQATIKHELAHCLTLGWEYLLNNIRDNGKTLNGSFTKHTQDSFFELYSLIDEQTASMICRVKLKGDK